MDYTDEQLDEFRKKAIDLREQMGLAKNVAILDKRFTPAQRNYFVACDNQGIPYKISARIMGVTDVERVYTWIYDRAHKMRNIQKPKTKEGSNNSQNKDGSDGPGKTESLEEREQSSPYPEETRDLDLVGVIRNYEAIERIIVPFLNIGAYAPIVLLYGDRKAPGSEIDKALSIFSTKADDIVRKVVRFETSKSFSSSPYIMSFKE